MRFVKISCLHSVPPFLHIYGIQSWSTGNVGAMRYEQRNESQRQQDSLLGKELDHKFKTLQPVNDQKLSLGRQTFENDMYAKNLQVFWLPGQG